ncbi:MAG: hypothetical protein AAFW70_11975, partial [Cyanobacteria bacterium J06635_10]
PRAILITYYSLLSPHRYDKCLTGHNITPNFLHGLHFPVLINPIRRVMASSFESKGPHFSIISLSSPGAGSLETILQFPFETLTTCQDSDLSIA